MNKPKRKTTKQHEMTAPWIEEASASARQMVNAMTDKQVERLVKQAMARVSAPKPKQNARHPRLSPKVGQVWTLEGSPVQWLIEYVTADNVISRYGAMSRYSSSGYDRAQFYDRAQWLADRKAGTIKLVRAGK